MTNNKLNLVKLILSACLVILSFTPSAQITEDWSKIIDRPYYGDCDYASKVILGPDY